MLLIPGYKLILNNRQHLARYRSGGIALLVKNNISDFIKIDSSPQSKLIQWFTISSLITDCNADIHCGIIYIPPIGSKYAHEDPYTELLAEVLRYCPESKFILLMGDFNSRTGVKDDFITIDRHLCKTYGYEQLVDESEEIMYYFEQNQISLKRTNTDQMINCYGNQMLDFCKTLDLFILNGRLHPTMQSMKLTCKDKSTVDYFLSTAMMFTRLQNFQILEYNPLLSDAHCPLSVNLNVIIDKRQNQNIHSPSNVNFKTKLWDSEKADLFQENLDIDLFRQIDLELEQLLNRDHISQSDVNSIVSSIEHIFNTCAEMSFGKIRINKNKTKKTRHRKRYNPLALYHSSYWSHCWMDTHFLMYLLRVL